MSLLGLLFTAVLAVAKPPTPPPAPPVAPPISFSAGFSSDAVLQRSSVQGAKVYGFTTTDRPVTVEVPSFPATAGYPLHPFRHKTHPTGGGVGVLFLCFSEVVWGVLGWPFEFRRSAHPPTRLVPLVLPHPHFQKVSAGAGAGPPLRYKVQATVAPWVSTSGCNSTGCIDPKTPQMPLHGRFTWVAELNPTSVPGGAFIISASVGTVQRLRHHFAPFLPRPRPPTPPPTCTQVRDLHLRSAS